MSVAPITPKEAQKQQLAKVIPDEVYEAVNELLSERYSNSEIIIYQDEVISKAIEKMQADATSDPRKEFFMCHWLDFEPAYEEAGWIVSFKKPAYNESFKAHWVFRKNYE